MKKLSILLLSVITLGLSVSSCSSNDSNTGSIEGKWELTQEGTILNDKEVLVDIPSSSSLCGKDYLEFEKGGLLNDFSFGQSDTDCSKPAESGVWIKTDNKLNITYSSKAVSSYDIMELSNTTLKLKETDSDGVYILVLKRK